MNPDSDIMKKAALLDRPDILRFLFHPRKAHAVSPQEHVSEVALQAGDNTVIGCRLHMVGQNNPNLLFFHGNGEIAHDYDSLGPLYNKAGLNFIVADYRGYGISTGNPSVSAMFTDAYAVFEHISRMLQDSGHTGPMWIMGRSLGSAPAIELAAAFQTRVAGLIVESGFAEVRGLLERLGILPRDLAAAPESELFSNAETLKGFKGPVLIIHAEKDDIIPLRHGITLHESAGGTRKEIRIIHNADHNNILGIAGMAYFDYIREFVGGRS